MPALFAPPRDLALAPGTQPPLTSEDIQKYLSRLEGPPLLFEQTLAEATKRLRTLPPEQQEAALQALASFRKSGGSKNPLQDDFIRALALELTPAVSALNAKRHARMVEAVWQAELPIGHIGERVEELSLLPTRSHHRGSRKERRPIYNPKAMKAAKKESLRINGQYDYDNNNCRQYCQGLDFQCLQNILFSSLSCRLLKPPKSQKNSVIQRPRNFDYKRGTLVRDFTPSQWGNLDSKTRQSYLNGERIGYITFPVPAAKLLEHPERYLQPGDMVHYTSPRSGGLHVGKFDGQDIVNFNGRICRDPLREAFSITSTVRISRLITRTTIGQMVGGEFVRQEPLK